MPTNGPTGNLQSAAGGDGGDGVGGTARTSHPGRLSQAVYSRVSSRKKEPEAGKEGDQPLERESQRERRQKVSTSSGCSLTVNKFYFK